MLEDQIEVAVVMQDATARNMGAGGDHQIGRRQAMVTDSPEIVLRAESGAFDSLVNREVRKPFETFHPFAVFRGVPGRIPGLQEKRQAGCESPLFDPVEDDVLAIRRNLIRQQP